MILSGLFIFLVSYALCCLCFFDKVGGGRQFGQEVVERIDTSHHFEQCDECGGGDIHVGAVFEASYRVVAETCKVCRFLLRELESETVVSETFAEQAQQVIAGVFVQVCHD